MNRLLKMCALTACMLTGLALKRVQLASSDLRLQEVGKDGDKGLYVQDPDPH